MKLPQILKHTGQLDDIARAAGINSHCQLFRNRQIVNRREMKHARRFALDQLEIRSTQRQLRLADVAFDKLKSSDISSTERRDPCDLFPRPAEQRRLHEQDEIAVLARQSFEKPVGDETRKSGYEKCLSIRHRLP